VNIAVGRPSLAEASLNASASANSGPFTAPTAEPAPAAEPAAASLSMICVQRRSGRSSGLLTSISQLASLGDCPSTSASLWPPANQIDPCVHGPKKARPSSIWKLPRRLRAESTVIPLAIGARHDDPCNHECRRDD